MCRLSRDVKFYPQWKTFYYYYYHYYYYYYYYYGGKKEWGAQGGHTGREVAFLHHVPHSFLLTSYSYAPAALLRKLETNNHA